MRGAYMRSIILGGCDKQAVRTPPRTHDVTTPRPYAFEPNPDGDHCLPCCFAMAHEAQTGERLAMDEVEHLTGYVSGRPTWSYAAMLALGNAGLDVTLIEATSPQAFVTDPKAEVRRVFGEAEAERWVLGHDALDVEASRVRHCLAHSRVAFEARQPTIEDIRAALRRQASVIVSLNHETLLGTDGYTPHFVIVSDVCASHVVLDNPGPPAVEQQLVTLDQFLSAWCSPKAEAANILMAEAHR